MSLKAFRVNIVGLSNKIHHFEYEIGDEFFGHYGTGLVSQGAFHVDVAFDKRETFIEASFQIKGEVMLICDRSLDPFKQPMKIDKKIVFKYGEANEELSDEIMMIHRDTDSLELGQYIYEFIGLEVPMKKLHPRYRDEMETADEAEGKIIYTSRNQQENEDIDPRWEKLKKLK